MRLRISAIVIAAVAVSTSASACLTEPLPSAILFDTPPAEVPMDSVTIVVRVIEPIANSFSVKAKVLRASAPLRKGEVVEINPDWPTSCLTLGRMNDDAFAVVINPANSPASPALIARSYSRSWWDTLWAWFGWQTFTPTGNPLGSPFPQNGIPE